MEGARKHLKITFEGVDVGKKLKNEIASLRVRLVERELLNDPKFSDKNVMVLGFGEEGGVFWVENQSNTPLVLQLTLIVDAKFKGDVSILVTDLAIPRGDFAQWFHLSDGEIYTGDMGIDDDGTPRILLSFHWGGEEESIDPSLATSVFEDTMAKANPNLNTPQPSHSKNKSDYSGSSQKPPISKHMPDSRFSSRQATSERPSPVTPKHHKVSESDVMPDQMNSNGRYSRDTETKLARALAEIERLNNELKRKNTMIEALQSENDLLQAKFKRVTEESTLLKTVNRQLELKLNPNRPNESAAEKVVISKPSPERTISSKKAMPSQPALIARVQVYFAKRNPEMEVQHIGGNVFEVGGHKMTLRLASQSLVVKTQNGYIPITQYISLHSAHFLNRQETPKKRTSPRTNSRGALKSSRERSSSRVSRENRSGSPSSSSKVFRETYKGEGRVSARYRS
jgi:hypothetical protein